MTEQHPIIPPLELMEQWHKECHKTHEPFLVHIAKQAAQWGADQELESCVAWLDGYEREGWAAHQLRNDRRPKPPSLKEQALKALGPEPLPETGPTGDTILNGGSIAYHRLIRRALESIND